VTTGELDEGQVVGSRIDATMATTGVPITTVTADAGYAYGKVYGALERCCIEAVIPARRRCRGGADPQPRAAASVPLRRPERHREVPARQGPAADPAGPARPVLLLPGQGLRTLPAILALPFQGPGQQGRRDQR
jgi:hypothetical protein